jgi:5'-deoxynucleotidase YfbR-like HD superfamily hydrolase
LKKRLLKLNLPLVGREVEEDGNSEPTNELFLDLDEMEGCLESGEGILENEEEEDIDRFLESGGDTKLLS